MYPKEVIEEIKKRITLSSIIQNYVPLKKQGANYIGLCPFHSEKTPSFTVSDEKQFFHCFGCHKSGDVYRFLQEIKNQSFNESIKEVAEYIGFPLDQYQEDGKKQDEQQKQREDFLQIHKMAAQTYHQTLLHTDLASIARQYIKDRQISSSMVQQFQIGYAPDDWSYLYQALKKSNYSDGSLLSSNLIRRNRMGNLHDLFHKRLMFPIWDEYNRLVAFGGRIIDDGEPKYFNSPESSLFKKREILYGLNFATEEIKKKQFAIVVEGYFDVIAAHQFGLKNTVATLGTSLSPYHLKKIERLCKGVVFVFDPDNAGSAATFRAIENSLKTSLKTYIVMLPENLDPYDYLLKYGAKGFIQHLKQERLDVLDFEIQKRMETYNTKDYNGVQKFLKDFFTFLDKINDPSIIDFGIHRVAIHLQLNEERLQQSFNQFKVGKNQYRARYSKDQATAYSPENILDANYSHKKVERAFIYFLLHNPSCIPMFLFKVEQEEIYDPMVKLLLKSLLNYMKEHYNIDQLIDISAMDQDTSEKIQVSSPPVDYLLESIEKEEDREEFLRELLENSDFYSHNIEQNLREIFSRIKYIHLNKKSQIIQQKINDAQKNNKLDQVKELMEEKLFLTNEAKKYSNVMTNKG